MTRAVCTASDIGQCPHCLMRTTLVVHTITIPPVATIGGHHTYGAPSDGKTTGATIIASAKGTINSAVVRSHATRPESTSAIRLRAVRIANPGYSGMRYT